MGPYKCEAQGICPPCHPLNPALSSSSSISSSSISSSSI